MVSKTVCSMCMCVCAFFVGGQMPKGASCILTNWLDSQGVSNTQLVDQEFPSCLALGVFDENWTKKTCWSLAISFLGKPLWHDIFFVCEAAVRNRICVDIFFDDAGMPHVFRPDIPLCV